VKLLIMLPPFAIAALIATLVVLDHAAAYRSPLEGAGPDSPRAGALVQLTSWYEAKAQEQARVAELLANLDTATMVELGQEIVHGRGLCFNCHRVGPEGRGTQGPDLDGVGARAGTRVDGMRGVEYLTQSMFEPSAFVVEGFPNAMTAVDEPPIDLSELDALMVVAYLQSLGGTPTVGPETELAH
jgi:hypothetical protein